MTTLTNKKIAMANPRAGTTSGQVPERPTEFKANKDKRHTLFVLKKTKLPLPPESDKLPSTRAVNGSPLIAVILPATIQDRNTPFSV